MALILFFGDMDSCSHCKKDVPADAAIYCDLCHSCLHSTCSGLSRNDVLYMRSKNRKLTYHCATCTDLKSQLSKIHQLTDLVNSLQNEILSLKAKVDVAASITGGKPDITHNLTIAEDIISEVMEREKRRNNLIIFNLPEMERATRIEQTAADTASVQDIFTYLGVSTEVSNPVRLGKYDPTSIQRKRPLRITLPSTTVINEVLRGNKKIKQMERFKSVVINKDKTPNQLRFFKSVKEQLNARLSSGETALTIRYIRDVPTIVEMGNHSGN